MLLTNYAIRSAGQARSYGGNIDPTVGLNPSRWMTFYVGDNDVVNVTDRTSQPAQGLRPPYGLLLAPKEGGMSAYSPNVASIDATGVQGMFTTADLSGTGTITDAAMGLTVEMVAALLGTGSLSAGIVGAFEAAATLSGSASVSNAAIGALAGMVAELIGSGAVTATQVATGLLEATIYVNEGTATVEQIVNEVVQAIIDMGATGGLTTEEHEQLMKTLTVGKFVGLQ